MAGAEGVKTKRDDRHSEKLRVSPSPYLEAMRWVMNHKMSEDTTEMEKTVRMLFNEDRLEFLNRLEKLESELGRRRDQAYFRIVKENREKRKERLQSKRMDREAAVEPILGENGSGADEGGERLSEVLLRLLKECSNVANAGISSVKVGLE